MGREYKGIGQFLCMVIVSSESITWTGVAQEIKLDIKSGYILHLIHLDGV